MFEGRTVKGAMPERRLCVEWVGPADELLAAEPSHGEIERVAEALAEAYNEPHNRAMMANTVAFSPDDVVAHYARMGEEGARPFLLYRDGALVGDADFRRFDGDGGVEFAILIAQRAHQGRGLGTRFGVLLHALAFRALGCKRVYVSILPHNVASRRLFEKLGYSADDSPVARACADGAGDVTMSIDERALAQAHEDALRALVIRER
jgi:RimJ/RimL family protein N-acetyltransferase